MSDYSLFILDLSENGDEFTVEGVDTILGICQSWNCLAMKPIRFYVHSKPGAVAYTVAVNVTGAGSYENAWREFASLMASHAVEARGREWRAKAVNNG